MSDIRDTVRKEYGKIGAAGNRAEGCCASACGSNQAEDRSRKLGYSKKDLAKVPEGANLGLGCGVPQVIASLQPGETVVDLGSGGGFDCFLAADQVGESGKVIGVDMTPEMVSRARQNAQNTGIKNVEFRLGEIEHLPISDQSADVILSNCVINLAPDKESVYREAFRVLKPDGRLAIADVVATVELPDEIRNDLEAHTSCVAGAVEIGALEALLAEIHFDNIKIRPWDGSRELIREWRPDLKVEDYVVSATIEARRP